MSDKRGVRNHSEQYQYCEIMYLNDKIYFLRKELEAAVKNPLVRPALWFRANKGILEDSRSHDWEDLVFLQTVTHFRGECTLLLTYIRMAEDQQRPTPVTISALEKVVERIDDCLKTISEGR